MFESSSALRRPGGCRAVELRWASGELGATFVPDAARLPVAHLEAHVRISGASHPLSDGAQDLVRDLVGRSVAVDRDGIGQASERLAQRPGLSFVDFEPPRNCGVRVIRAILRCAPVPQALGQDLPRHFKPDGDGRGSRRPSCASVPCRDRASLGVRGYPSRTKPWSGASDSSCSRTSLSMSLSGTSSPAVISSRICSASGEPVATCWRRMRPGLTWTSPSRSASREACVPLPAPGGPSTMIWSGESPISNNQLDQFRVGELVFRDVMVQLPSDYVDFLAR